MIALDTNVLIRVLVDDPGEASQVAAARSRVERAGQVYVPQVVQVETVWVLETAYGFDKAAVVSVLEHLAGNEAFFLQSPETFRMAMAEYRTGSADFSDYVILMESRAAQLKLLSFDRRLRHSAGVIGLSG